MAGKGVEKGAEKGYSESPGGRPCLTPMIDSADRIHKAAARAAGERMRGEALFRRRVARRTREAAAAEREAFRDFFREEVPALRAAGLALEAGGHFENPRTRVTGPAGEMDVRIRRGLWHAAGECGGRDRASRDRFLALAAGLLEMKEGER